MRKLKNAAIAVTIFISLMIVFSRVVSSNEENGYLYLNEVMDKYHQTFDVYTDRDAGGNHFFASGWIGDTEDITFNSAWTENPYSGTSCIKITYSPEGAFGWAGILWQTPENNWATVENAGYDLTGATAINFYARGEQGGEEIEFFAGGIDGEFGDSMPKVSLGYISLSQDWQQYTIDISGQDLSYIIGGFGWVTNHIHNPDGATFYLDQIQYNLERLNDRRFLRSYETIQLEEPDFVLTNAAYTYDNALAALAYIARGTNDDLHRAELILDAFVHAQKNDRYYKDGRLRNAYMAGDLFDQTDETETVRLPGWWDDEEEEWYEDSGQVSTYTGNMAWVMIAFLKYYEEVEQNAEYLSAAKELGEWIVKETYDSQGVGGYTAGYQGWEPNPKKLTSKSTEHNIDVYVAFMNLYHVTDEPVWEERAKNALKFLEAMWNDEEGRFWIGTTEDGQTIWKEPGVQPMDVNTWGFMALYQSDTYERGIDWVEKYCSATCSGFEGFDYNADDRPGVWFEGTAQMVVAYQLLGEDANADYYLAEIREAQTEALNSNGKGIIAACPDGLDTNLGWLFYSRLHVGATCWYLFAEREYNPLKVSLSPLFGDVSDNNKVTAYDAALIFQHIRGIIQLEPDQIERGDVDNKPGLSSSDAGLILQKVVELIPDFPGE